MKIVFLGFQRWGYASLKALLDSKHEVSLVFTHSQDKCTYKGSFLDRSVKELAISKNIPVVETRRIDTDELVNMIKDQAPDVIVSSDWETKISSEVAEIANKAAVNIHDALLPKYGGFSPVNWAMINGETEAGVTVHYLEEILDQGKIILQETVSINEKDTIVEVLEKIFKKISQITLDALSLIETDKVEALEQDLSKASFYHKIREQDSEINWHRSRKDIYNFIRALSDPFTNAHTYFQGQKIKIKKTSVPGKVYCGMPGRLMCREKHGVVVLCGKDKSNPSQGLVIEQIQDPSGKMWQANDFFPRMGFYLGSSRP